MREWYMQRRKNAGIRIYMRKPQENENEYLKKQIEGDSQIYVF